MPPKPKKIKLPEGQAKLPFIQSSSAPVTQPGPSGEASSQKKKAKFQFSWLQLHPWLQYRDNALFCAVCMKAGCRNQFTQEGCTNFRTSALTQHLDGKDNTRPLLSLKHRRIRKKNEQESEIVSREGCSSEVKSGEVARKIKCMICVCMI